MTRNAILIFIACLVVHSPAMAVPDDQFPHVHSSAQVDCTSLRGKVMCGYQGWFRCPGDAANMGWVHWSRDSRRITPQTLTFDMWPDVSDLPASARYAAPGFSHPDGSQAYLFSSDNSTVVQKHFEWMRDYGIDGAWLQQFLVDLPGGPQQDRYPSRSRVLHDVAQAASSTGRAWALSYDISGSPPEKIFDLLTTDWKKLVAQKITADRNYLHEGGKPVVQIWGFYHGNAHSPMTPELGNRLIDFFKTPGLTAAYLVGGGDWDWRRNPDPAWQALYRRLDAYAPWNVGNYSTDSSGVKHAAMAMWVQDKKEYEHDGRLWIPVVYPGFSWHNLQRLPAGAGEIPRRGGRFLWEQFHELAALKPASVYVAMFDEVDEGTAIFKLSRSPPTQGHFVDMEGLPSDWYLRLVGEGTRVLRGERADSSDIPRS